MVHSSLGVNPNVGKVDQPVKFKAKQINNKENLGDIEMLIWEQSWKPDQNADMAVILLLFNWC